MDERTLEGDGVETPVQPVLPPAGPVRARTRGRLEGLSIAVVVVAVALLAGVLSVPGAGTTPLASGSNEPSAAGSERPTPTGSPAASCAAPPAGTRTTALLRIDGVPPIAGMQDDGGPPDLPTRAPNATDWPSDAEFDAYVNTGAALAIDTYYADCPPRWQVELDGVAVGRLGNPNQGHQNTFSFTVRTAVLRLAVLRASYTFDHVPVTFRWRILIGPPDTAGVISIQVPQLYVSGWGDTFIDPVPGCAFEVTYPETGAYDMTCEIDGPSVPLPLARIPAGATVYVMGFGDGFERVSDPNGPEAFTCGHMATLHEFQADPTCVLGYAAPANQLFGFVAPAVAGSWAIAIHGCVIGGEGPGIRACGTWFAMLETSPGPFSPEPDPPG